MNRIDTKVEKIAVGPNPEEYRIRTIGGSYVPDRDIREIAKEIRVLIRKAIQAGYLPKLKASVSIQRAKGKNSLDTIYIVINKVDACVINVETWRRFSYGGVPMPSDYRVTCNHRGIGIINLIRQFAEAFMLHEVDPDGSGWSGSFFYQIEFSGWVEGTQNSQFGEKTDW